jgi:type I restriction enzyme S subunit
MYKIVKLSEIAKITTGFPFKGDKYSNHGIRVVRGENITVGSLRWDNIKCWNQEFDQAEKYLLKVGDVVIGMDGSKVGKNRARIKFSDLPLLLAQRVALIRKNELSDQTFLYYLIRSNKFEEFVEKIQTGSSVPHISQKQIEEYLVPLIPVKTQEKIASVLSALDSKIEINNKISAELESMAKTLYDYWFVQFDFPDEYGKPYKTDGGKMVWNEELKREIPEGLEVSRINSIIEVKDGTHDSPKPKLEGYPLITSKNLNVSGLDFENANLISKEDFLSVIKRSNVETGDILFSMIGSIGTLYKVEEKEINFAIKNVALYKTSKNQDYKNYIYMFLKSIDMGRYMKNTISGSIQKFIGLSSLRETPIISNNTMVKRYNELTFPIFERLETVKLENQKLVELRDWLLPMLMNGQVKVS